MKEESEFKMVVDVLLHRLRWRLDTLQLSSAMVFVADKIGDPNRALVFVGPGKSKDTVWVMSSAVPSRAPGLSGKADTAAVTAAHPVELVRPNMSIVNWHSPALARDIQELEKHWAEINVPMKMATKSPLPPDFRVLPGDYGVWQDVFSHMMDDYLLNTSAARADVATLLRLYNLSEIHDIQVLRTAYIGAISKKLSIDNISQVGSHTYIYCHFFAATKFIFYPTLRLTIGVGSSPRPCGNSGQEETARGGRGCTVSGCSHRPYSGAGLLGLPRQSSGIADAFEA
jgi:hypothetical protein